MHKFETMKSSLVALALFLFAVSAVALPPGHVEGPTNIHARGPAAVDHARFSVMLAHMEMVRRFLAMEPAERLKNMVGPQADAFRDSLAALNVKVSLDGRDMTRGEALKILDEQIQKLIRENQPENWKNESKVKELERLMDARDKVLGKTKDSVMDRRFEKDELGLALQKVDFGRASGEIARRLWSGMVLTEGLRNKVLEEMRTKKIEDPALTDEMRYEIFNKIMNGEGGPPTAKREGMIQRYERLLGADSPLVTYLKGYFKAHTRSGSGGKKPSLRLLENADLALNALAAKKLAARGLEGEDKAKQLTLYKAEETEQADHGPMAIADALAGRDAKRPASDQEYEASQKALDAVMSDADAAAGLGFIAGGHVRFRNLQDKGFGKSKGDPEAREKEMGEAMSHYLVTSELERKALQNADEQKKFLEEPEKWMNDFLRDHAKDKDQIERDRETNRRLYKVICDKCKQLQIFPMGCPARAG